MKHTLLGAALLLSVSHTLFAAPIVLTGKNVRFILDDALLTAFEGTKPTVQEDTLVFLPAVATYNAEALVPQKSVGFKSQAIEFNVEALGGQVLKSITLRSSGFKAVQGKSILTNALAFGKLNAKDRQLVNRSVEFAAVDASAGSWQALNIGTDPKGTEATVKDITSHSLAVSASHNLRALALALDSVGNASIDARDGVSFTLGTAVAAKPDRLFDWAESVLPILGAGSLTETLTGSVSLQCNKVGEACGNLDGLSFRCYPAAKLCYGIKDDVAYSYDFKDQIVRTIGSSQLYFDQAVKSGF
ncbi:MAG: hypothetical protein HOP02_03855 [Methylococcaceae bacterium]|nr:hypothetical protein [Methylococcaceae bacterium]